jgi:MerR family transcriptional regulator, copper efflux regulator
VTTHMTSKRRLAILHMPESVPGDDRPAGVVDCGPLPDEGSLQVGDLARLTGKTVRALHLYESLGLLRPADRSPGGFRLYRADSVERVRWISKLQTLGFSLPEIGKIVRDQEGAPSGIAAASSLRAVFEQRLSGIRDKLSELHRLEHELLSSLTYLDACHSACSSPTTTVDACPSCGRHLDQPEQPALIAGLHAH